MIEVLWITSTKSAHSKVQKETGLETEYQDNAPVE